MLIVYICIFFLGASIASFLNATLYRKENKFKQKEFLTQPSHCEKCKKELTWYELIPIIGYIIQKGKCSKCKTPINIYYPISELILGTTALLFYIYPVPWYMIIIILFLFILSYYDQKDHTVPQNLVHILIGFSLAIFFIYSREYANMIFPLGIAVVFLLMNLVKKSFGMGDILIILGIGILLNYKTFLTFFWISILTALIYSLIYIWIKKKNIKKAKIPMVPFLMIGYIIAVLYGEKIFNYFL